MPDSARSTSYDPDFSPALRQPLDSIADNSINELCILAPTGGGKTAILESALCYVIAEDPGPTLIAFQNIDEVNKWFRGRAEKILKSCEPVVEAAPGKLKNRKGEILLPTMPLWLQGANIGGLQGKSCRFVWGDEVWCWQPGMIREAEARTHDRWNARFILVSQGGIEGSEWHQRWLESPQRHACVTCPACKASFVPTIDNLKYDDCRNGAGIWDMQAAGKSARFECLSCKATVPDNPQARRSLVTPTIYEQRNLNPKPKSDGFTFTFWHCWWIPWSKITQEWIRANEAKHKGDTGLLQRFMQKRLASFWSSKVEVAISKLVGAGYLKAQYGNGELWDGERIRFLTIDVQQDHYWAVVRSWKIDGSSRLLWEGKVLTAESLKTLQLQFKVAPRCVLIDSKYESTRIYALCVEHGWVAIQGTGEKSFPHVEKRGDKQVVIYRYYSAPQKVAAGNGRALMVRFSNEKIKDILAALRSGRGAAWEIPDDFSEAYEYQIDSEVKREPVTEKKDGTLKVGEMRWEKIKHDNHLFDCEVLQVLAAVTVKILGSLETIEGESDASGDRVYQLK